MHRILISIAIALLTFAAAPAADAETRTFELTASQFTFTPSIIEVQQGDRVVVRLRSTDVEHGFEIDDFGVRRVVPKTGEVVTAEFTASRPGTYTFRCSEYCGEGHRGMTGTLVVHPAAAGDGAAPPPAAAPSELDFELATLPTTARVPRSRGAFRVTHRFTRPLGQGDFGDLASDFFAFDSSAEVGMGVRFGLTDTLQLGLYRTSDRTIQVFAQQELVRAGDAFPLTAALLAGIEGEDNMGLSDEAEGTTPEHNYSPAVSLVLSRALGSRTMAYVVPTFVGNTNPHPPRSDDGGESSVLVGLGLRVRLGTKTYVSAEASPRIAGFRPTRGDGRDSAPLLAFAFERRLGGHVFQISAQNATGTTPAQVARAQDNLTNDWYLGFRISRKFF
jgi:cytochrome c oxidase subunit 2